MIKVDGDEYDDELFDGLINKEKQLESTAKKFGLTLEEATSVIREATADNALQRAKVFAQEAEREYSYAGLEDKAFECKQIVKKIHSILNMGRSSNPPPSGMY